MKRLSVVLAFVLLAVAGPVSAAPPPWIRVTVDGVCRSGDVISIDVSWSHVHPQLTRLGVWGGVSEADPGVRLWVQVTDRHATNWTIDVPSSWFDDRGYVVGSVLAESRRVSYWVGNGEFWLAEITACPSD